MSIWGRLCRSGCTRRSEQRILGPPRMIARQLPYPTCDNLQRTLDHRHKKGSERLCAVGPGRPKWGWAKVADSPAGLLRNPWASSEPVREAFRRAFEAANLPYCNPHSLRTMMIRHATSLNLTPEQMKAWSQNLGHADVLTTLTSYGSVPVHRQGELIRATDPPGAVDADQVAALEAVLASMQAGRLPGLPAA